MRGHFTQPHLQQSCMELFIGQSSLWLLTIFSYTCSSTPYTFSPQDQCWMWQVSMTTLYERPEIKYTLKWMWGQALLSLYRKLVEDYFSRLDIKGDDYRSQLATTGHYPVAPLYTLCTSKTTIHPVHKQDHYTTWTQARQLYTLYTRNIPGK